MCVCLYVYLYPPIFRHDCRFATKFGMHMRIDPGINRTQKHLTHPTPGGSQGVDVLGVNISKVW